MSGFLYIQAGELNVQWWIQVLVYQNPPFSHTHVCAVSYISCASTLSDSLIKVKSLDKEPLHFCLPASISSREGLPEVLGPKPFSFYADPYKDRLCELGPAS